MKKHLSIITLILALGCGKSELQTQKSQLAKEVQEQEAKLKTFAIQYGANGPWVEDEPSPDKFTSDYQETLIQSQVKPIAFDACLEDIIIESDQHIGYFRVFGSNIPILLLRLRMNAQALKVSKEMGKSYSSCLVVAKDLKPKLEVERNNEIIVADGVCIVVQQQ